MDHDGEFPDPPMEESNNKSPKRRLLTHKFGYSAFTTATLTICCTWYHD